MSALTVNTKRFGSGVLKRGGAAGTQLGLVKRAHVRWGMFVPLNAEEINAPWEVLFLGDAVRLTCVMSGWDSDMRQAIFPNHSSGNPQWPGSTIVPGAPLATISNLIFIPDDSAFPRVTLNSAVAVLESPDPEGIALGGKRTLEVEVVFHGLPDDNDSVGSMAPA